MRKSLFASLLFVFIFVCWGTAEAKPAGNITINLRSCIDAGDGACLSQAGDVYLDGVTVCLRKAGEEERCSRTEDGEHWVDSQPHGSYWARAEAPAGYRLVGATCTTYPNIPYSPCQVRDNEVHFVAHKGVNAINVNFLLAAD